MTRAYAYDPPLPCWTHSGHLHSVLGPASLCSSEVPTVAPVDRTGKDPLLGGIPAQNQKATQLGAFNEKSES